MLTKSIYSLHDFLIKKNVIKSVERATIFYDEPQVHHFAAILNIPDTYPYKEQLGETGASGISFDNPKEAIMKCMYESIERYSLLFWDGVITKVKIKDLHPAFIESNTSLHPDNIVGTVISENIQTGKSTSVPAQSIYLTYSNKLNEPFLSTLITTGTAGGYSSKSALTRALLEVIERDSFMTRYLLKIWPKRINSETIEDQQIQSIFVYLKRYNLTPYIFDSTNDLGIPTFYRILVDQTGIGPAISSGLSAQLTPIKAIKNAVLESFITRWWIRKELLLNKVRSKNSLVPKKILTVRDRAFYWSPTKMLSQLTPLLSQPAVSLHDNTYLEIPSSQLAKYLIDRGFTIFKKDITNNIFQSLDYIIIRAVVPEMQPLYLKETQPIYRKKRLKQVANFFGVTKTILNTLPHPFL
jgi:ribosomal protein S12 methylthiotransferase accessory factor